MLGGAPVESPGGAELLTLTVARDEHGYGMKVSGDNPVYVQSVKEHGPAWRAGLRAGDRILRVDNQIVAHHSHQQVVQMIRDNPTTVLTVQQHASKLKTPITSPVPANLEKQRQFEASKVKTMRLMLDKEQKYIRDLRNELLKVPDVRKSAELESAEQRCSTLQREIDVMMGTCQLAPTTPRNARTKADKPANHPTPNTGFLSGLPRSLSNLTGQSLRNLRQARQKQDTPPLVRQNSDESNNKRRHIHNNTVPMVPTTCLDNSPPPLPPRSIERPKRSPTSPITPISPLANPVAKKYYKPLPETPRMAQSMPAYSDVQYRRSSHSLDGELDGPQPNSIALQMSYPLVNVPPPPLQMDNRNSVPVLHMRSRSSPEQIDHDLSKSFTGMPSPIPCHSSGQRTAEWSARDTPPPGTPPPPYHTNTQPCADPQRAIISMEEDDSPASDNSTYSGLFSNLRSVRESKARTAVLLNWLLGERRCACACLLLVLTDSYRSGAVPVATLRRWAYEIHSAFLMPHAVLQLTGVDENMANEIEHVLVNEFEKEELLRNVFRKARQKAKEELAGQLSEFQVKRQVGLASLYGPDDNVIDKCDVDKIQEQAVVERLMCARLQQLSAAGAGAGAPGGCVGRAGAGGAARAEDAQNTLLAALAAAALALQCRPAAVASALGGQRAAFLQRDKIYKQRLKQINKQHQQPFVVRGHHLQLQSLTSVAHCHHCDNVIWGLAPQAYFCTDCKLRVHRACARQVEEACCIDGDHAHHTNHNNRISRFMERIHQNNQLNSQDSNDKKSRKASGTTNFLNMERSIRRAEDEQPWEQSPAPATIERRDESDESLYESADGHSDTISASDDALPRLSKTPTMSKESLKLAVTDEEAETKFKKGHRKAMSLSNPIEMVKNLGDEWLITHKKELEKNSDKKKSRESLWSEEDRDSINGSSTFLDQIRKNSRKEDKSQSISRKISTVDAPKTRKTSKGSSVSALNFLRRKKTPTSVKPVEVVPEDPTKVLTIHEILHFTSMFLEAEKRLAAVENRPPAKPPVETDSDDEGPTAKQLEQHRRRLSRQTSRSKSKIRGKSQSLKINTLRKSHSGTLKKAKKKGSKTPSMGRSRQTSIVEQTPIVKKKHSQSMKQNSWLFSSSRGETRREGSNDEPTVPDADVDTSDAATKDSDKDNSWRAPPSVGRGVNRAESCRERDAPRRGKHRNASDPNRLTAHNNNDLEPGSATAPSGSSSSSSLSSRSNESNTVATEQQASQSDVSDEDEALAAQWADSISPHVLSSINLSARLRKRQEVIHELIVSEGSHVRWLKVLGRVFLRPLESQPTLLPPEELKALFPNLPSVRERHVKLYSELRALRNDVDAPLVDISAVADAMMNTLGEVGYASTLSRFCRGQRMALESLRERRRKNKELHQFLAGREQSPLCGRLQLRDLLACVWQRLTKYQLLLESVLKTVETEDSIEKERIHKALGVAKEVLHSVDTAIRTAENEHRLRSIQSKLEIRCPHGADWEELRRFELSAHALRMEGELAIRNDSNKKIHVLALMLEDSLVLIQREGDKFLLKPIPQPSQQQNLSPLIKWDKVLFRPNAAVRNAFFLMNINGVQMHELSANSAQEYATWVKHIQEAPLAKLTELKPNITTSHQASRSTDDSGINVSRNPSDASEKSNSTAEEDIERDRLERAESERERASAERAESERERLSAERAESERERLSAERIESEREKEGSSTEREERSTEKEEGREEKEEKHKIRRPTVGRISTHDAEPPLPLEPRAAFTVTEPAAHTAHTALSNQERLRRLDAGISRCLRAKALVVADMLGVPPRHYSQVADLAVAEALGQVDVSGELRARGELAGEGEEAEGEESPDLQQLLLAACTQANQLTLLVRGALSVSEGAGVGVRARAPRGAGGRCDACRNTRHAAAAVVRPSAPPEETDVDSDLKPEELRDASLDEEYDTLSELEASRGDEDDPIEWSVGAARLGARLVEATCGLQGTLAQMLASAAGAASRDQRAERALLREHNDALRARLRVYEQQSTEISYPKAETTIQDQPSNGG